MQKEKFFEFVESRPEDTVEEWIQSLKCPVIRIDGTKSVEGNVDFITEQLQNLFPSLRGRYNDRNQICKLKR